MQFSRSQDPPVSALSHLVEHTCRDGNISINKSIKSSKNVKLSTLVDQQMGRRKDGGHADCNFNSTGFSFKFSIFLSFFQIILIDFQRQFVFDARYFFMEFWRTSRKSRLSSKSTEANAPNFRHSPVTFQNCPQRLQFRFVGGTENANPPNKMPRARVKNFNNFFSGKWAEAHQPFGEWAGRARARARARAKYPAKFENSHFF